MKKAMLDHAELAKKRGSIPVDSIALHLRFLRREGYSASYIRELVDQASAELEEI